MLRRLVLLLIVLPSMLLLNTASAQAYGCLPDCVPDTATVTIHVNGAGSVLRNGAPICTAAGTNSARQTCLISFNVGAQLTITPAGNGDSTFRNWSGSCSGSAGCSLTVTDGIDVTATFVDTTPPAIPSITFPADYFTVGITTSSYSPSVEFSSDQTATQYRCTLDGGAMSTCAPGSSFGPLGGGEHVIAVYAQDVNGNVSQSATVHIRVLVRPHLSMDGSTHDHAYLSARSTSYTYGVYPNETVYATYPQPTTMTRTCKLDDATIPCVADLGPYLPAGTSEGVHTLVFHASVAAWGRTFDDTGYVLRYFTIDTIAPDTTLTTGTPVTLTTTTAGAVSTALQFTGSDAAALKSDMSRPNQLYFECSVDGGAYTPCASGNPLMIGAGGTHSVAIRARDLAGNVDPTPATATVIVAADLDHDGSFTPTDCNDADAAIHPGSLDVPGNAIDEDCSGADTIDSSAPDTTLTTSPQGIVFGSDAVVSFSGLDPAPGTAVTFECSLDGGAWAACVSGANFGPVALGLHTIRVRALDAFGNRDATPVSVTWTVIADADMDGSLAPIADCNDANPAIHPGAVEIAGNAVDENCDGVVAAGPTPDATAAPSLTKAAWKLVATWKQSRLGSTASKLRVTGLPAGAKVAVTCAAKRRGACPFAKLSLRTTRGASNVLPSLKRRTLAVGTVLTIKVEAAGMLTKTIRVTIRARKAPFVTSSCAAPGSASKVAC